MCSELGELIVEGWSHLRREALHNVLHQRLGKGNAEKIFLVVKGLHNLQVGLKGLDFGGEIFSDLLDRLVSREEVECLIDVSPENIYTPEFFYQFDLEGGPVNDVVEWSSLARGMAFRVRATLTLSSAWVRLNPLRMVDNQG